MPNRLLAAYSYIFITTGWPVMSLTITSMHHPPSCDHPQPMLHNLHISSSPQPQHHQLRLTVLSVSQGWEAALRCGPDVFPPTHTQHHWWTYLTPFPLDGVVICVPLFKQTKAINETCQRLAALKPHSLCQIKIIDHWLQKAQWKADG